MFSLGHSLQVVQLPVASNVSFKVLVEVVMTDSLVEVHVLPVLSLKDPLSVQITQRRPSTDGPMTPADCGRDLRDVYTNLDQRVSALRPSESQILQAQLDGVELLHLFVGWYFGLRCPAHPFKLGHALVGDLGSIPPGRPLTIFGQRTHSRAPFCDNNEGATLVRWSYGETPKRVIGETPDTVTVNPSIARLSMEEIVALGWQIGLWYGNRTLLYPMGKGKRFRVADPGGLLGSIMELETDQ